MKVIFDIEEIVRMDEAERKGLIEQIQGRNLEIFEEEASEVCKETLEWMIKARLSGMKPYALLEALDEREAYIRLLNKHTPSSIFKKLKARKVEQSLENLIQRVSLFKFVNDI